MYIYKACETENIVGLKWSCKTFCLLERTIQLVFLLVVEM